MSDERDESDVDETGADPEERDAKEELFEAIDHFKSAASILFNRAKNDPAVKTAKTDLQKAGREAGRVAKRLADEAEPFAQRVGDAAEPIARQLTEEVGRLTRDVMDLVEGKRGAKKRRPKATTEEE